MNIRVRTSVAATGAIAALAVLAAVAAAPAAAQSGGARTLTLAVHARGSARAAFKEAAGMMRGLTNVRVRSAVSDKADRFVEGAFTATYAGTPVSGLLFAGTGGSAVAVLDSIDRAPETVPAALATMGARGAGGTAARALHRISFGSGSIALPDSWSVRNAYQGCVEAASQRDRAYLAFGCPQAALAPPLLPGTDPRTVLVVTSYDPVAALQRFMVSPPPAGIGAGGMRVREVKPVQAIANGRAAYVLFDYTVQGAPYTGLALVNLSATDARQFMFYKSMFMTPAATFPQLAPTLWTSWQSWGVNANVLSQRMFAAAQSMRETGDIITGAYWERQHTQDRVSLGFDQYIRDAAQMEDVGTGRRWNGSWDDLQHVVDANPNRFRIVPLSELQP